MKINGQPLEEFGFSTTDLIVIGLVVLGIVASIQISELSLLVLIPILVMFTFILIKENFIKIK